MDLTDLVATIIITALTSSGLIAAVLAILAYLGKNVFNTYLSQRLELHKSELERASFEHQTRFSSLHTKRATVIDGLYSRINQTLNDINMMTRVYRQEGSLIEDLDQAYNSGKELNDFFSQNRIYFNKEFSDRTQDFINKLYRLMIDFRLVAEDVENNENHRERLERWMKIIDTLRTEIQPINSELEKEFRELIGVN